MAEAAVENNTNARFFCHQCSREVSPTLPEFTCPRCQGGFIEQLSEDELSVDDEGSDQDPAEQFAQLWREAFSIQNLDSASTVDRGDDDRPRRGRHRRARIQIRSRPPVNPYPMASLDTILQQLFGLTPVARPGTSTNDTQGLGFPFNFLNLHGNMGDYAWGQHGLDEIITQLLNQMEGSGPPPAKPETIESIPFATVSQEQVDIKLECVVCREAFSVGESVKMLPCNHYFHKDCIEPWLQLHETCPTCRVSVTTGKPTDQPRAL